MPVITQKAVYLFLIQCDRYIYHKYLSEEKTIVIVMLMG